MTDVFISYSRKDIAFARLLHQALKENDLKTRIDWQDIPLAPTGWRMCMRPSSIRTHSSSSSAQPRQVLKMEQENRAYCQAQ